MIPRIKTYPQIAFKSNEDVGFDMEYNVFCDLYGDYFVDNWLDAYHDRVTGGFNGREKERCYI